MKKEADENIDQTASTQTARTEGTTSNRQTGLMQETDPEMILLSYPTERAEPTGHGDAHDAGEDFPLPRLARLCLVEAPPGPGAGASARAGPPRGWPSQSPRASRLSGPPAPIS